MCRVAQTRLRRLVAGGCCIVLWYFVGGAADCGGGYDRKEVIMEIILFAFFGFVLGLIVGASVAGIVASSINDKILENNEKLCNSCGNTLIKAMDKMYEYGQKVKELEDKRLNEYLDSNNGGIVPPNKNREDFITRSETVVDINKLKEVFEKEQQKQ